MFETKQTCGEKNLLLNLFTKSSLQIYPFPHQPVVFILHGTGQLESVAFEYT
jgi:hypothetical protein